MVLVQPRTQIVDRIVSCVTSGLSAPGVRVGLARSEVELDAWPRTRSAATARTTASATSRSLPVERTRSTVRRTVARRQTPFGTRPLLRCAERFELAALRESLQRARLDLAHSLARQAHDAPDLLQRLRIRVA